MCEYITIAIFADQDRLARTEARRTPLGAAPLAGTLRPTRLHTHKQLEAALLTLHLMKEYVSHPRATLVLEQLVLMKIFMF